MRARRQLASGNSRIIRLHPVIPASSNSPFDAPHHILSIGRIDLLCRATLLSLRQCGTTWRGAGSIESKTNKWILSEVEKGVYWDN